MYIDAITLWQPSPAQSLVQLYKALIFVATILGQRKFGVKQRTLRVEDLEIRGDTATVALQRSVHRFLKVMDRDLLRHAYAVKFVISDQRIGDITEGSLDRFFVGDQVLPLLTFGEP